MRVWHIGLLVGLLMLLIHGAAAAQENEQREAQTRMAPPLLRALDVDGDGALSAEEIAAATSALNELDADADGVLSRQEMAGERRPAGGRGFADGAGRGSLAMRAFAGRARVMSSRGVAPLGRGGFRGWSPRASRPGGRVGRPWPGGFQFSRPGITGRAGGRPGAGEMRFGPDAAARGEGSMLDQLFERFDEGGEGILSEENVPQMLWQRLLRVDGDGDGRVTREEAEAGAEALRERGGLRRPRGGRGPESRIDSEQ